RGILRKESILFIFIFSYMLPMCYFVPLARYRLVLIPVFCMLAPYPFFAAWKAWHKKKLLLVLVPIVIYTIILYINLPLNSFLRSTDFVSYGKGMQLKTGKPASALPYLYEAYKMAPYKQMTVVNFADALLKNRNPQEAVKVLRHALKNSPENLAYRYYLGIAYFFTGKAEQAEQLFSKINPDDMGSLKVKYYYFYSESLRAQNKHNAAAKLRQKALKDSNRK
ncbi:MAG: tetratricopeptide repeat protein, partial [Victivallaceae bacterium]|nr:tetratricopeptide repeat protein [Victivallaceae bacterium]